MTPVTCWWSPEGRISSHPRDSVGEWTTRQAQSLIGVDLGELPSTFQAGPLSFHSEAYFWHTWGEIAIQAEAEALRHRASFERGDHRGLIPELKATLIAINACSFALEAFSNQVWTRYTAQVRERGDKPEVNPNTFINEKGKRQRRPASERIWLILDEAFDLAYLNAGWAASFESLFRLRNRSVHYKSRLQPAVKHPSMPTHVDPEHLEFDAPSAEWAVSLYLRVLESCFTHLKPESSWSFYSPAMVASLCRYRVAQQTKG